jgi:hypothetical protein
MSAYQLGYLFGTILGGVLGLALAYKLLKSPKKANRVLGGVAGVFAVAYIASALVQSGAGQQRKDFEAGFRSGCVEKCATNAERSTCQAYCDCQLSKLLGVPDPDRVISAFKNVRSAADLPADQRAQLVAASAECTPPELYDASFIASCTSSCSSPDCPARCRCTLDKLREGMDPAAGTRWLLSNIEKDPPTPEGEAKLADAVAACAAAEAAE